MIGCVTVCMIFFLAFQQQFMPSFLENDINLGLELGIRHFALKRWCVFAMLAMIFCGLCVVCLQVVFQAFILNEVVSIRLFPSLAAPIFLLMTWGPHYWMLDKKLKKVYTNKQFN